MDLRHSFDDKSESRLYVGNLDLRITEAAFIKMFASFGNIVSEDFLWHTRGSRQGAPRGYAFIQFSTKKEAELAKEKMHGKLVNGRPMVVRLASEKCVEASNNSSKANNKGEVSKSNQAGSFSGQPKLPNKSAKIAAIKNKLKAMEAEDHACKKLRHVGDDVAQSAENPPSANG